MKEATFNNYAKACGEQVTKLMLEEREPIMACHKHAMENGDKDFSISASLKLMGAVAPRFAKTVLAYSRKTKIESIEERCSKGPQEDMFEGSTQ